MERKHHVVVVGGGFGGLRAAQRLQHNDRIKVTLVSREACHVFSPLLYHVAAGVLSEAAVQVPLREALTSPRVKVRQGEVDAVDLPARTLHLANGDSLAYDSLILAAGSRTADAGFPRWRQHAVGLHTLEDATTLRDQLRAALSRAAGLPEGSERDAARCVVIVGGGPTGVELAGAWAEVHTPAAPRIVLLERGPELCPGYPQAQRHAALSDLHRQGVDVRLNTPCERLQDGFVRALGADIAAALVVWVPGVQAASGGLIRGLPTTADGGTPVSSDCSLQGYPDVFAVGDLARTDDPLPQLAPVAQQMADCAAANVKCRLNGQPTQPLSYLNLGSMAAIGTHNALFARGWLAFSGWPVYAMWMGVHVGVLPTWTMRARVVREWVTYHSGLAAPPFADAAASVVASDSRQRQRAPGP